METRIKWYKGGLPKDAFLIRKSVFIDEQGYSEEQEFDCYDNKNSTIHIVIYSDEIPVAATRLYLKNNDKTAIFGRICVLKNFRNKKLGGLLVENLILKAKSLKADNCMISSQEYAIPFYENFGFSAYGNLYSDGHIPHKNMKLMLN